MQNRRSAQTSPITAATVGTCWIGKYFGYGTLMLLTAHNNKKRASEHRFHSSRGRMAWVLDMESPEGASLGVRLYRQPLAQKSKARLLVSNRASVFGSWLTEGRDVSVATRSIRSTDPVRYVILRRC